jgi:hypothetical protein
MTRTIFSVGFDGHPQGEYTLAMGETDWGPSLQKTFHPERLAIVPEGADDSGKKSLRVYYPKGEVRPEHSGTQFKVRLAGATDYWCDYRVRFEPGFDFRKGGKLPGLAGGKVTTGCRKPTGDGWSVRYMWRKQGALVLYIYHKRQLGNCAADSPLDAAVEVGRWHRLTQHVSVNTPGRADGTVRVWLDGVQKPGRNDIEFRTEKQAPVNCFLFSTFFGGKDPSFGPLKDCFIRFDDFYIGPDRPEGLE